MSTPTKPETKWTCPLCKEGEPMQCTGPWDCQDTEHLKSLTDEINFSPSAPDYSELLKLGFSITECPKEGDDVIAHYKDGRGSIIIQASPDHVHDEIIKSLFVLWKHAESKLEKQGWVSVKTEIENQITDLTLSLQVANQGLDILYSENEALKEQIKELGNQM